MVKMEEFPSSPVGGTLCGYCGDPGSVPGWATKSLQLHGTAEINKHTQNLKIVLNSLREFPGTPEVKTPCSHCKGYRFDP